MALTSELCHQYERIINHKIVAFAVCVFFAERFDAFITDIILLFGLWTIRLLNILNATKFNHFAKIIIYSAIFTEIFVQICAFFLKDTKENVCGCFLLKHPKS